MDIAACASPAWQEALRLHLQPLELNLVLKACGKAQDWRPAVQLLRRALSKDVVSFNSVLGSVARATAWTVALQIFQDLHQATFEPVPWQDLHETIMKPYN